MLHVSGDSFAKLGTAWIRWFMIRLLCLLNRSVSSSIYGWNTNHWNTGRKNWLERLGVCSYLHLVRSEESQQWRRFWNLIELVEGSKKLLETIWFSTWTIWGFLVSIFVVSDCSTIVAPWSGIIHEVEVISEWYAVWASDMGLFGLQDRTIFTSFMVSHPYLSLNPNNFGGLL